MSILVAIREHLLLPHHPRSNLPSFRSHPLPPQKRKFPPVVGNFNVLMSTTHGELPNNHVPEVCDIKEGTSDTLDLTSLLL
ncbi:hypothetical protein CEXT_222861 [Caerostris extrusa]|uniref:Uncharacterized protein n=1 Tax=Caerostris extrusa TaxID=172846 RepID=A0AAV4NMQ6_CAEEX|nr:hypothetical protein CEXT_222861 [Caerostris extrusa]